jgi:3-oxoacyl-[acyl-carrier protein] reductase
MVMKPLARRVALVTGAGRAIGIGTAVCRRLAADGFDIAFTHFLAYDREMYDSPTDGPAALTAELEALGIRVFATEVDLSHPGCAAPLFDSVEAALGPVDVLVNNAAYSTHDNWETLTEASWDIHLNTNARATAMLTVEFARRFTRETGGRVINFSSGQHLGPMPDELAYISSKGAIIAFSSSIAVDLAKKGITVNVVNPGPTDTGYMNDELKAHLLVHFPMGRIGQPDDVARLVSWLANPESVWVTGQVINSEGGFWR